MQIDPGAGRPVRAGGLALAPAPTAEAAARVCASSTGTTASRRRASRSRAGSAKFQRLASRFPNDPTGFTLLYLGSTWLPRDLGPAPRTRASVARFRSS